MDRILWITTSWEQNRLKMSKAGPNEVFVVPLAGGYSFNSLINKAFFWDRSDFSGPKLCDALRYGKRPSIYLSPDFPLVNDTGCQNVEMSQETFWTNLRVTWSIPLGHHIQHPPPPRIFITHLDLPTCGAFVSRNHINCHQLRWTIVRGTSSSRLISIPSQSKCHRFSGSMP